jgi:hypothetical protein
MLKAYDVDVVYKMVSLGQGHVPTRMVIAEVI